MTQYLRIRKATYDDYEPWMKEKGIPLPDEDVIEYVDEADISVEKPSSATTE